MDPTTPQSGALPGKQTKKETKYYLDLNLYVIILFKHFVRIQSTGKG